MTRMTPIADRRCTPRPRTNGRRALRPWTGSCGSSLEPRHHRLDLVAGDRRCVGVHLQPAEPKGDYAFRKFQHLVHVVAMRRTATPSPATRRISSQVARFCFRPRAAVGSSNIISRFPRIIARAIAIACRWPPESRRTASRGSGSVVPKLESRSAAIDADAFLSTNFKDRSRSEQVPGRERCLLGRDGCRRVRAQVHRLDPEGPSAAWCQRADPVGADYSSPRSGL